MKLSDIFLNSMPYFYSWIDENSCFNIFQADQKKQLEEYVPDPHELRKHLVSTVALIYDRNGFHFHTNDETDRGNNFGYFEIDGHSLGFNRGLTMVHTDSDYIHLSNGDYIIFGEDYLPQMIDDILDDVNFHYLVRQAFWKADWLVPKYPGNMGNKNILDYLITNELKEEFNAKGISLTKNRVEKKVRFMLKDKHGEDLQPVPYTIVKSWVQPGSQLKELEDGWFQIIKV